MADWKKLRHATGPATRVPAQVKDLVGKDESRRWVALDALSSTLVGERTWSKASGPALELLLDSLPGASFKALVLLLVAEMLGADHVRGWLEPTSSGPPAAVQKPALSRKAALLAEVSAKDPNVRAAALLVLAMLPGLGREALGLALDRARSDGDDVVQASALLALGRLGERSPDALDVVREEQTRSASDVVRGAATLARLRLDPKRALRDEVEGLAAWLRWPVPGPPGVTVLPWFRSPPTSWYAALSSERFGETWFLRGPSLGLLSLARHRKQRAVLLDVTLQVGAARPNGPLTRAAGEILLELSDLSHRKNAALKFVALPEELTKPQQKLARRLAPTTLLPEAGFGLPACGDPRRRWIGLQPPGPLDRPVEVEPGRRVPFWRAWHELVRRGVHDGNPIPSPIDGLLHGADHWQAVVEQSVHSYGGPYKYVGPELVEKELERAAGKDLVGRARRVADDLAIRLEALEAEGREAIVWFTTSALVLLPLVRAGIPLEPRWDRLVSVGEQPQVREILNALPADRREAVAWRQLVAQPTDVSVVPVLDLVPSRRIGELVLRRLANPDAVDLLDEDVPGYVARIRKLARSHLGLKQAVKSTQIAS